MGIRRSEGSFEGEQGRRLFRRSWRGSEPERAVLLVHGFGEHSGRYEDLGSWLADRGSAVHAYDHQGHGRSSGPRNYVARFEDLLSDLDRFLACVRQEHPTVPITVVGHSMGGLVTAAFARERKPEITSLVTSGAALALGPAMSGPRMLLVRALRRVVPRLLLSAGLPSEGLSRDPEVQRRYEADPLVDTRMTPALAVEMMDAVARTAAGGAEIAVPMLLLHGADDPLCSASGSEAFFRSLPAGTSPPSALKIYPGLRHEIFNEPEKEQVFDDLLSWVRARETERGRSEAIRETASA